MSQSVKTNGLLGEMQQRLDEYFAWVKDRTTIKQIEGGKEYVEITTPHLDRHNDCLQIYVRRDNGGYLLTDDSYVIDDLEMSGCKLDSPKRQELLSLTLNGFGVERRDRALVVHATQQNFARKKHDLVQAMLAVNDMFALAGPTITSLFIEDVSAWLEQNDVRYVPRVQLAGKSGYNHTFDFVIPKYRNTPERIIQTMNTPNKSAAEALAFKWIDTHQSRDQNSIAYAILNDQEQNIPSGVRDALESYNIKTVAWSDREVIVEELAA